VLGDKLQGTSEALHHAQARSEQSLASAGIARLLANEATHSAQEHGAHRSEQALVPRHKQSQRKRERQNELPQRHIRNDVVHQVRRKLAHFSANARTADRTAFAGKANEPFVLAAGTNYTHKAFCDVATSEDGFELAPNEARQVDVCRLKLGAGLRERVDKDAAQRGVLWAARSIQSPRDDARTGPRW